MGERRNKMYGYKTIRRTAKDHQLSENMLRMRLKQRLLPGFYGGNRFNVDVDELLTMLHKESMESVSERTAV